MQAKEQNAVHCTKSSNINIIKLYCSLDNTLLNYFSFLFCYNDNRDDYEKDIILSVTQATRKKIPSSPNRSRTYDLPHTGRMLYH